MTIPLAFGFGVPETYTNKANRRARPYVRWMGFAFAPLHLAFIYTDRLIVGTYDPHTEWSRVRVAIALFGTALLTLMRRPPIGERYLLLIHAIAWMGGQASVLQMALKVDRLPVQCSDLKNLRESLQRPPRYHLNQRLQESFRRSDLSPAKQWTMI